ncbi:MAG: ATP-binding protein [Saprospiraceae bacterium]
MLNILKNRIYSIINNGINDTQTNYDKIRIRVLNSLLLLIFTFQFAVWTQELIQIDFQGVKILSCHLIFTIFLLFLSKKEYIRTASFLINFLYPTALFGLVFIYLQPNNLEYIFVLFIFTSVIISKTVWEKVMLVSINLGYYAFTQTGHEMIGQLGKEINAINNFFIFLMTFGTFVIILQILLYELQKYEQDNQLLILKLEEQNKTLSEVNEELERFTYVVSHDMKTPLRAINSFITIIERKLNKDDVEINRYFKYVKDGTKQLHQLIMDSLEYARLGKEAIEMKRVSSNELFFDLVRHFTDENVEIYTDDYPDILTNKTLVRKLFQNIIENGLKYNNSEIKTINITATTTDKEVTFSFQDNGIGIKKEYHKKIFEMYKRLNGKDKYSGTGLGLAICQKIALQLKGEIIVESEVGKGSIFHIRLPKA